jgi:thioredoxin-like negative regulator of GroEL
MKFEVFGKQRCPKCTSTKEKLDHLLRKADAATFVAVAFIDVDTIEGMAEGAFNDVAQVPTVILRSEAGEALARWEGRIPPSIEVQAMLGSRQSAGAVE